MSSKQKLILFLAVVLAGLLYFAPKQLREKKQEEAVSNFSSVIEEAKKQLSPQQKTTVENLETLSDKEENGQKKIVLLDSLRKTWLRYKNPALYAVYGKAIAEIDNTAQRWALSADDFMKAGKFSNDANKGTMYKSAIEAYEKALAMNPSDLLVKTKLGTCYVESSSLLGGQPMKGISLLREVIQQDSTNVEANLQLGLFSVTSRQFDKAIERFKRILRTDSTHIDMYVYLGDTYLAMGDKPKAIESYESYKAHVKDSLVIKDIDGYIKKLKNQP